MCSIMFYIKIIKGPKTLCADKHWKQISDLNRESYFRIAALQDTLWVNFIEQALYQPSMTLFSVYISRLTKPDK